MKMLITASVGGGACTPSPPLTTYAEKDYEDVDDSIGGWGGFCPQPPLTTYAEKDYEDVEDSIGLAPPALPRPFMLVFFQI